MRLGFEGDSMEKGRMKMMEREKEGRKGDI
jgi:hypothetical protein